MLTTLAALLATHAALTALASASVLFPYVISRLVESQKKVNRAAIGGDKFARAFIATERARAQSEWEILVAESFSQHKAENADTDILSYPTRKAS